jgi:hypothetical protein
MKKWSQENNDILLNKHQNGEDVKSIAIFFNTTEIAIKTQIRRLGIVKFKRFNEKELELLKQLYPIKTYEELSLIFNRTIPAINYQVKQMENYGKRIVKLKPEYFSDIKNRLVNGERIVDISKIYKVSQSTLKQFCIKNGLNPTADLYTYEMKNRHKLKSNVGFYRLLKSYKRNAKVNNIKFELTEKEFENLTKGNCFYCNSVPKKISKSISGKSDYIYNGIDKKTPELGYIIKNCVSCCWECNQLKTNYTFEEFFNIIKTIYNNLTKSNSE